MNHSWSSWNLKVLLLETSQTEFLIIFKERIISLCLSPPPLCVCVSASEMVTSLIKKTIQCKRHAEDSRPKTKAWSQKTKTKENCLETRKKISLKHAQNISSSWNTILLFNMGKESGKIAPCAFFYVFWFLQYVSSILFLLFSL